MKTRDDFDKLVDGERGIRRAITLTNDPAERQQMIGTLGLLVKLQHDPEFDDLRPIPELAPYEQAPLDFRYKGD